MLFRSMADIYENLMSFIVAELNGEVVGCCSLQIIWSDLAEIKSLAVHEHAMGKGLGRELVTSALQRAYAIGISSVFALTVNTDFFEKMGFQRIKKDALPMKVWKDCASCPKQAHCDEIAVIKQLHQS